jgi:hypothetical protein
MSATTIMTAITGVFIATSLPWSRRPAKLNAQTEPGIMSVIADEMIS